MDRAMTIEEIKSQFESEWVLIGDPQTNDALEILEGNVLHHSKDRDEVYRKAVTLRPKRSAAVYLRCIEARAMEPTLPEG